MCHTQSLHSCNGSHSLNRHKLGERKLCSYLFVTSNLPIPQGSLKQRQTPEEFSAHRDYPCMWKNTLPCSRIISFISPTHTHTQRLFLLARSIRLGSALCQHMHSLGLGRSEPTEYLFTEVPHKTAMISLTLSEAQPSMQSIRPSTFAPPSCLLAGLVFFQG